MNIIKGVLNVLPPFKGKLRLSKLLIVNKKKKREFKTSGNLMFSVPNLQENVSFELFVNGVYEIDTIKFICSVIPENGCFVDVGANIGSICAEVASRRPDLKVYAFEASPRVFEFLNKNKIQNNLNNLNVYNLAIHEDDDIEMKFYSPEDLNGKGSFSPVFTKKFENVKTIRLDTFFKKNDLNPDFIKVDVEGYELLVFKSLSNHKPVKHFEILFEFVDWAEEAANFRIGSAQDYLIQAGYQLRKFPEQHDIYNSLKSGSEMITAKIELSESLFE